MYHHDSRLQYPITIGRPNPAFATLLQQATGGVEGEIRVYMQYFFQPWGNRAPNPKHRDMLLHTATEELGGHGGTLPIPNSFPQGQEYQQNNYHFHATAVDGSVSEGRWTSGPSIDGKGEFTVFRNEPLGDTPNLGPARPDSAAETQQIG